MYNNYYQAPMGTMYQQPLRHALMTQPLSQEELKALQSQNVSFSMKVDPKDMVASKCTHKQGDKITLINKGDDIVTCSLCGETFKLLADDTIDANAIAENAVDLIQSIKTLYLDMPLEYAENIPVIIPFLRKLPQLYKIALNNYRKYEDAGMLRQVQPYYSTSNMYNSLISGTYNMQPQPMMGQPVYNPNYMNPQAQMLMDPNMSAFNQMQQPYMNQYSTPSSVSPFQQQVPGYNPVNMPGTTAPFQQQVIQPQVQQPQVQQPQVQQPAQPQAQPATNQNTVAQPTEVQQQKVFQV